MNFGTLLWHAARKALSESDRSIGVRISPLDLRPEDLESVIEQTAAEREAGLHIVLSCPGAEVREAGRLAVFPDDRAAELANRWRNSVQIDAGERLFYASAEVHGKAGSLDDCLTKFTEDDLSQSFFELLRGRYEVPVDVARELGELVQPSPRLLTELGIQLERSEASTWEQRLGEALPVVSLLPDGELTAENAAQRLKANRKIVELAHTNERRPKRISDKVSQLIDGLETAGVDGEGLRSFSLEDLATEELESLVPKPRKTPGSSKGKGKAKGKSRGRNKGKSTKKKVGADSEAAPASSSTDSSAELTAPTNNTNKPEGDDQAAAKAEAIDPEAAAAELLASVRVPPLPSGALKLLRESYTHDGDGLSWDVGLALPRSWLASVPRRLPPPTRVELPEQAGAELRALHQSRRELRRELLAKVDPKTLDQLSQSPLALLSDPELRTCSEKLLRATTALLEQALREPVSVRQAMLNMESVRLRSRRGMLLMLSPLHPLSLAQLLGRVEAARDASPLERAELPLARAALSRSLESPSRWHDSDNQGLVAGSSCAPLVCFESEGSSLSAVEAAELGEKLGALYLRNHPHATLGLRVAIKGDSPSGLADGLARLVGDGPGETQRLELLCSTPPGGLELNPRIRLSSYPTDPKSSPDSDRVIDVASPHLIFRLDPPSSRPEEVEEPKVDVQPAPGGLGLLPRRFRMVRGRLRAEVVLSSSDSLVALERLLASCSGAMPRGVFVRERRPVRLIGFQTAKRTVAWEVTVASRVSSSPPEGQTLVMHERLEDAEVAITTRDAEPLARAVQPLLRRLGSGDERVESARIVAEFLAETDPGGLLALGRSMFEQSLATLLRAVAVTRYGEEVGLQALSPETVQLITGASLPEGTVLGLGVAHKQGRLTLFGGIATVSTELAFSSRGAELVGSGAALLRPLLDFLKRSQSPSSPVEHVAQRLVSSLLWQAVAGSRKPSEPLAEALCRLSEQAAELESVVLAPSVKQDRDDLSLRDLSLSARRLTPALIDELLWS